MNATLLRNSRMVKWGVGGAIAIILGGFALLDGGDALRRAGGTVFASAAFAEPAPTEAQGGSTGGMDAAAGLDEPIGPVFEDDPLQSLAEALRRKERELKERERELEQREEYLEALKLETERNLQRVEEALGRMQEIAERATSERRKQLSQWIDIYQKMDPVKVAATMRELDIDFQLELLSQMEISKAAKIIEEFPTEQAIELGRRLND